MTEQKSEVALVIQNVTRQARWRDLGDGCLLTLFPDAWVAFKKHSPESDAYDGAENWMHAFVFDIEYERKHRTRMVKGVVRLEVWYKGGDSNVNPFYYFCVGRSDGRLYFIPQFSPHFGGSPTAEKIIHNLCDCGFDNSKTQHKFCPECGIPLEREKREDAEEVVDIVPTEENIARFIKERFLTDEGRVSDEFEGTENEVDIEFFLESQ